MQLSSKRDLYAGSLIILLGLVAAVEGGRYGIGNLHHMGPGFFPVVLGAVLALTGGILAWGATKADVPDSGETLEKPPSLRGGICIILGVLSFILLGEYGGMIPASFTCLFITALGDRTSSLKSALTLAAGGTIVGVLVFSYGLQMQFPLFRWF